ncbi:MULTISPECIES: restriction endonuclease subunit S [Pseudomonas]|uniref:restriction endonuclease subunit S n=1 Tax=Pseudomonas TaxID=286 RepID=UPI0009A4361F|nr:MULTISPECIES: restriction endonuclease subunit S [Pseudomonas]MBG6284340.1 restriction endonuclease subunit S [Pseudomonas aeruginosa]MCD2950637.1 restriction endonuclease subunit S [Pseudomonas aeruginosa]MCO3875965.1 restriction endonuclease subunit S [Pseudomonas aeruginosa]MCV0289144.1 restriction endonuclease subunit S [Pseudomonas aeruginosa]RQC18965.1 restriction endonuclease subunit S [Pseudomonas aeruginosa]
MNQAAEISMPTEGNVPKDDWEHVLLDSVTKRGSGHTPDKKHPEYWDGSIKWISLQDSAQLDALYIEDTAATITIEGIKNSSAVLHQKGTVVLSRDAGVGKSAIMATDMAVSQHFMAWTCGQRLDNHFLYYWLQSKKPEFERIANGNTIKTIGLPYFKELTIPLPPLEEQKHIASALSGIDTLISSLDQLIAKKRDIQQTTMQQLLTGQIRLPGFRGEWNVKPMRALGNTYGGLAGKTKIDFGHGEARYIPFMNVMTDTVIDASWLEPVDVAPDEAQNLAKKGDLFFNGSSETPEEVGFCSVLLDEIPNLYLNSFCFGFRFNTAARVNGLFFAYWFRSKAGRAAMSVLAQGATRYNIAKSAFMQLEIPQPLEEEQTAISTVLSDMDAELAALETRRDKARQIKQGMMQELLTGRIRLK